jgi:hypothetical protein
MIPRRIFPYTSLWVWKRLAHRSASRRRWNLGISRWINRHACLETSSSSPYDCYSLQEPRQDITTGEHKALNSRVSIPMSVLCSMFLKRKADDTISLDDGRCAHRESLIIPSTLACLALGEHTSTTVAPSQHTNSQRFVFVVRGTAGRVPVSATRLVPLARVGPRVHMCVEVLVTV